MARPTVNGAEDGNSGVEVIDISQQFRGTDDGDNDSSGIPTVEPASIIIEPDAGTGKRGRGRPRGSTNAARKQAPKEVSADLTSLLLTTHFMLAKLTKVSELELTEEEAKILGDAMARVNREFGVQIMSPKTAALVNLATAGVGVYGPRMMAMANNAKNKKEAEKRGPQMVVPPVGVGVAAPSGVM